MTTKTDTVSKHKKFFGHSVSRIGWFLFRHLEKKTYPLTKKKRGIQIPGRENRLYVVMVSVLRIWIQILDSIYNFKYQINKLQLACLSMFKVKFLLNKCSFSFQYNSSVLSYENEFLLYWNTNVYPLVIIHKVSKYCLIITFYIYN
jgi:hypothetical protein